MLPKTRNRISATSWRDHSWRPRVAERNARSAVWDKRMSPLSRQACFVAAVLLFWQLDSAFGVLLPSDAQKVSMGDPAASSVAAGGMAGADKETASVSTATDNAELVGADGGSAETAALADASKTANSKRDTNDGATSADNPKRDTSAPEPSSGGKAPFTAASTVAASEASTVNVNTNAAASFAPESADVSNGSTDNVLQKEKLHADISPLGADALLKEQSEARAWLTQYEKEQLPLCLETTEAAWEYASNITDHNSKKAADATKKMVDFGGKKGREAQKFHWKNFGDKGLRRVFKSLTNLGVAALSAEKTSELINLRQDMEGNHAKAKVCPYRGPDQEKAKPEECTLLLEPDIKGILEDSNNYDELLHVWAQFRDKAGRPVKEKWLRAAALLNEASQANGRKDYTEDLLEMYYEESPDFEKDLEELWTTLKPLYQQLHAYVRTKLIERYPGKIKEDGPIPAHLLGHIHAQHVSIKGLEPFKGRSSVDVTEMMIKRNMTPVDIFKLSEEFFTSLGLKPMTNEFWQRSILEKPNDGRDLVCHASAWDACGTDLVRIKQCTRVKMSDLIVAHHEMGHIEYYLQYQKLPSYYQAGANPGFHEAVGDTLALSVSTLKHLRAIGLLEQGNVTQEDTINYLMNIAFDKIAILPSAYFFDLWRWNVYRNKYSKDKLNDEWWKLHLEYAGYCPGVRRSNEDFDPASKYHISSGTPYIRYFVANILQFQFYEALCDASGHEGPLHECDFYRSKAAGKLMGDMLALGSSKPWPEALRAITGGKAVKMDARPILRYFQPLYDWLVKYNMGKPVGWTSPDPNECPKP